jgi:hypothetical protein
MKETCDHCGAELGITRYHSSKAGARGKYCSAQCCAIGIGMGRCKNCRHWTDPKQQTWWDSFAMWGQCVKTNVDENDSPLMIAEVNPVRFIPVTTREDFGCVMFESKGAE